MRMSLLPILCLTVLAGGMGVSNVSQGGCRQIQGRSESRNQESQKPLDFTLPTLTDENKTMTLSEMTREHPVLLIFWATWCPACLKEISVLNGWHRKWEPRGLRIVSVDVEESREHLLQFYNRRRIDYPVLLDRDGKVADRFGLVGLPVSILLAKGGKIIYYGFSLPNLERHLDKGEWR